MQTEHQDFLPEPVAARQARSFVRTTLERWNADALEWSASQVVSELTTNAILHAKTNFRVQLSFDGEILQVRISDGSTRTPLVRPISERSTTGRGLSLVAQLSQEWGIDADDTGKTVWCTFALTEKEPPERFVSSHSNDTTSRSTHASASSASPRAQSRAA